VISRNIADRRGDCSSHRRVKAAPELPGWSRRIAANPLPHCKNLTVFL